MRGSALILFSSALACTTSIASATPVATFTRLGDLPGGTFSSEARDVSADGSTVVGVARGASGDEAFRWMAGGGMMGLGDLPGGAFRSYANGVSADGSVVIGASEVTASGYFESYEAFRWTSEGGMVGLGDFAGGEFGSGAEDVSADGSTVVGGAGGASRYAEAFRWTVAGGMVAIGPDLSIAYAISADGSVVVGHSPDGAFRWTQSDGLAYLTPFSMPADAYGVSADGAVVVGWEADQALHGAFRWTADTGRIPIPGLGIASDVSADGALVVGIDCCLDVAMIADIGTGGAYELQDLLETRYGLDLAGWTLSWATGISDDGHVIVGYGTNPDGHREAWRVTISEFVPEPGTVLLLACGLVPLAARRRAIR